MDMKSPPNKNAPRADCSKAAAHGRPLVARLATLVASTCNASIRWMLGAGHHDRRWYPLAVELDAADIDSQVVHDLAEVFASQRVVGLLAAVGRSAGRTTM